MNAEEWTLWTNLLPHISPDNARAIIEGRTSLETLKIAELKTIIAHYKSKGFRMCISGNKSALIAELSNFLLSNAKTGQTETTDPIVVTDSNANHKAHTSTVASVLPAFHPANVSRPLGFASNSAYDPTRASVPQVKKPGIVKSIVPGIDSIAKRTVYEQLGKLGVGHFEARDAVTRWTGPPDAEINLDDVMLLIMQRRSELEEAARRRAEEMDKLLKVSGLIANCSGMNCSIKSMSKDLTFF